MRKGFYLAVDGEDGVGKTFVCHALRERIQEESDHFVWLVKEPDPRYACGEIIEEVRRGLHREYNTMTRALLFAANRNDIIERRVLPLVRGSQSNVVISDRCVLSSMVYQNMGKRGFARVMSINPTVLPDMIALLSASHSAIQQRIAVRGYERDEFDRNYQQLPARYESAARYLEVGFGVIVLRVDANQPAHRVVNDIVNAMYDEIDRRLSEIQT